MKLLAISRADGGLSIMRCIGVPADEIEKWTANASPSWLPITWREIHPSKVPPDRRKREAWRLLGDSVVVDDSRWDIVLSRQAAENIDRMDRLQFEHLFELENRTRVLELKTPVTRLQYRQALINRWKELNA